jgi:GMP synthase (glutamine-hydrolysing)
MTLRIHTLQHVPFEGPGCIRQWAEDAGTRLTGSRLFCGEPLPSLADFDWLVVMGGPMNIYEEGRYPWLAEEKAFIAQAIENQKVVLGICLGAQLIADALDARISSNQTKEIGWYPVYRTIPRAQFPQLAAMEEKLEALHWHADTFDLPEGAVHLARSEGCENQAFVYNHRVLGLQFHLEMTQDGLQDLLQHCAGDLTAGPFVQSAATMLANPLQFRRANRIMHRLLDGLAGLHRI